MQDPFKDARYRQLFSGFMCAGIRDALSRGKAITPREVDGIFAQWLAVDEAGAAEAMLKLGEQLGAKLVQ